MSLALKIAKRFVLAKNTNTEDQGAGFVSFIASISIIGLSLGVTSLLVVTSVMNGFERELARTLTSFHSHVIFFSRSEAMGNYRKIEKEILTQFPDVVAASPYIFAEVMLSSPKGVGGSVVEAVDFDSVGKVSELPQKLIAGKFPTEAFEITLGVELARKLMVGPGDTVLLTIPFAGREESPLVKKLKVSGILKYGMYEYDNKYSVMSVTDFQNILSMGDKVNAFKILTKDANQSLKTTSALNEKFSYPLRARDWSSLNKNLFYAIRLEKAVISIILLSIILVASFNIISTIMMTVHDKKAQVSMLKALGWSKRQTLVVFLMIGGSLSVLGTLLGLVLGRALCAIVSWKSIIDLPADIYMFNRLPVEIRPVEWILICLAAISIATLSTFFPSRRIAKQSPVEGLRYE